jgi:hypothetical protein
LKICFKKKKISPLFSDEERADDERSDFVEVIAVSVVFEDVGPLDEVVFFDELLFDVVLVDSVFLDAVFSFADAVSSFADAVGRRADFSLEDFRDAVAALSDSLCVFVTRIDSGFAVAVVKLHSLWPLAVLILVELATTLAPPRETDDATGVPGGRHC